MKCSTPECDWPAVGYDDGEALCDDCMRDRMEIEEAEMDAIHDAAKEAGSDDWYYGRTQNPYAAGSQQAEIWDYAYRNAYARTRSGLLTCGLI